MSDEYTQTHLPGATPASRYERLADAVQNGGGEAGPVVFNNHRPPILVPIDRDFHRRAGELQRVLHQSAKAMQKFGGLVDHRFILNHHRRRFAAIEGDADARSFRPMRFDDQIDAAPMVGSGGVFDHRAQRHR